MKRVAPDGPDPGDAELLRRVKRGDTDAFAPVVRRHLPSLRATVNAGQFERLRRRLEQAAAPGSDGSDRTPSRSQSTSPAPP